MQTTSLNCRLLNNLGLVMSYLGTIKQVFTKLRRATSFEKIKIFVLGGKKLEVATPKFTKTYFVVKSRPTVCACLIPF